MNSQESWLCLSVEEFFSHCNWQGKSLESSHKQQAVSLPLISVQAEMAEMNGQESLPCLSVEEFFSHCNWQGRPQESLQRQHPSQSLVLTLQVGEFFQFIPWEGKPEIGSLPKVSFVEEPTPIGSFETTLTDLSELF